jgi:hypothetical protein
MILTFLAKLALFAFGLVILAGGVWRVVEWFRRV